MWGEIFLGATVIISIGIYLFRRDRDHFFSALGCLGSGLCVISLFAFPWLTTESDIRMQQNAAELARQSELIFWIKQLPGLNQWLKDVHVLSAGDVMDGINHPVKLQFMAAVKSGGRITGVQLVSLTLHIAPTLDLAIFGSGLIGALAWILLSLRLILTSRDKPYQRLEKPAGQPPVSYDNLYEEIDSTPESIAETKSPPYFASGFLRILSILSLICFLIIYSYLPSLETLAQRDDIYLRLLTVLAETHIAFGVWLAMLGLLMFSISSLQFFLPPHPSVEASKQYSYSNVESGGFNE
jgi:hypothetical protein